MADPQSGIQGEGGTPALKGEKAPAEQTA